MYEVNHIKHEPTTPQREPRTSSAAEPLDCLQDADGNWYMTVRDPGDFARDSNGNYRWTTPQAERVVSLLNPTEPLEAVYGEGDDAVVVPVIALALVEVLSDQHGHIYEEDTRHRFIWPVTIYDDWLLDTRCDLLPEVIRPAGAGAGDEAGEILKKARRARR
jgi:hypothetical protein